ncbi:hypothetical protein ACVWXL_004583 [Bradyrhizobium sp. GM22.5]
MRIGIVPANCLYPGERSIREQAVPHIARLLRPKFAVLMLLTSRADAPKLQQRAR